MSIVTVKNFGIALGVSGGTIRSKISRGQLLRNKKGFIDTEHPTNYIYILEVNGGNQECFEQFHIGNVSKSKISEKSITANKTSKNIEKTLKQPKIVEKQENKNPSDTVASVNIAPTVETKIKVEKKVVPKLTLEEKRELSAHKKHNELLLSFDLRKKEAEVLLKEREGELKQWELEKKAGNTLPLNMVERLVSVNYKAIFKSIHSQTKNIAMVMVQQLGGSKEDLDRIMIELEDILDMTVKDSEKKSAVDIEKLIDEYSEIRSRGERKV